MANSLKFIFTLLALLVNKVLIGQITHQIGFGYQLGYKKLNCAVITYRINKSKYLANFSLLTYNFPYRNIRVETFDSLSTYLVSNSPNKFTNLATAKLNMGFGIDLAVHIGKAFRNPTYLGIGFSFSQLSWNKSWVKTEDSYKIINNNLKRIINYYTNIDSNSQLNGININCNIIQNIWLSNRISLNVMIQSNMIIQNTRNIARYELFSLNDNKNAYITGKSSYISTKEKRQLLIPIGFPQFGIYFRLGKI